MVYFEWNSSWLTGVPVIDQQHKELVAEVDRFFQAIREGEQEAALDRILIHLSEYVEAHFRTEETFMAEAHDPGLPAHKAAHDALRARVKGLVEAHLRDSVPVTTEVTDYLRDWLVDHLYRTDQKMAEYLRQHPAP
jgi:hemerythrin